MAIDNKFVFQIKKMGQTLLKFTMILSLVYGCTARIDEHGNFPNQKLIAAIKIGVHTKDHVLKKLGTPSTVSSFDKLNWFYIGTRVRSVSFWAPNILKRKALKIRFNTEGIVQEIIGVDSTNLTEMAHIKRITPTKGKELTIIQQIIGNVGRFGSPVDKDPQF